MRNFIQSPLFWPRLAALLISVSMVLAMGFFPSISAYERLAAVLVGVAGLGALLWPGSALGDRTIAAPRLALFLLGFLALAVASASWSVAPALSLMHLGGLVLTVLTVITLLFSDPDMRDAFLRTAAWMIGGVMALVALWALVQGFFLPHLLVAGQVRHPFVNPNAFAAFLNMGFFVGLAVYLQTDDLRRKMMLWVWLLVILSAMVSIASKASSLVFIGGIVLAPLLFGVGPLRAHARPLLLLFGAALLMGVALALVPGKANLAGQFIDFFGRDYNTAHNRIDIWVATLEIIRNTPLLGTGYRTFQMVYPSVRLPAEVHSSGLMVHADPLQFWAEMGIGAVILFYAAGLAIALPFLRRRREGDRNILNAALFIAAAGLAAHAHVDFPLYTLPVSLLFALICGALAVRSATESATLRPFAFAARWRRGSAFMLPLVPLALVLGMFASAIAGEALLSRAAKQIFAGDVQGFAESVNAADRVGMGLNARAYIMAATVPIGILKERYPLIPVDEQRALYTQTTRLLDRAERVGGALPTIPFHRAELRRHTMPIIWPEKDERSAEDHYRTALARDPLHLPSRMGLADLLQRQKHDDELYDLLMAGLHWPYPTFDASQYHSMLDSLATARGDEVALERIRYAATLHMARVRKAQERHHDWERLREDLISGIR